MEYLESLNIYNNQALELINSIVDYGMKYYDHSKHRVGGFIYDILSQTDNTGCYIDFEKVDEFNW